MSRKYTIVIEPELHDWFAHRAIDVKVSISQLITDAMIVYRREHSPKNLASPSKSLTPDALVCNGNIPESQPKPYVKSIYHPGTKTLNDTQRARDVSRAARKVMSLLKKAEATGVPAQELHETLKNAGFEFQTCRETLTYLRENEIAKRRRSDWVHADFFRPPNVKPPLSDKDRGVQG